MLCRCGMICGCVAKSTSEPHVTYPLKPITTPKLILPSHCPTIIIEKLRWREDLCWTCGSPSWMLPVHHACRKFWTCVALLDLRQTSTDSFRSMEFHNRVWGNLAPSSFVPRVAYLSAALVGQDCPRKWNAMQRKQNPQTSGNQTIPRTRLHYGPKILSPSRFHQILSVLDNSRGVIPHFIYECCSAYASQTSSVSSS